METPKRSSSVDFESREREVLAFLDIWPWEAGGVVIGGYAISAYGPHRYSVDIDIVVPEATVAVVRGWLGNRGVNRVKHAVSNPRSPSGQVDRYRRGAITLDLLSGGVSVRDSKVEIPGPWITKKSRRIVLDTLSGKTSKPIPVARPEAMWAMKLLSGRDLDLTDLFAISDEPADLSEVEQLFRELATDELSKKLQAVISRLENRRVYEDSLSRRRLGSPKNPTNLRRWARFVSQAKGAIASVAGGP